MTGCHGGQIVVVVLAVRLLGSDREKLLRLHSNAHGN
jgi:hypothetical protein